MSIEKLITESLGNKPYCSKRQLIELCISLGLCRSITGANSALESLNWIKISPKRLVTPRQSVLEYFKKYNSDQGDDDVAG